MTIAKAVRSDSGQYTLALENQHGKATFTIELVVLGKPSAPENLRIVKVKEDTIDISWEEPNDDGGALIQHYIVEKREKGECGYIHVKFMVM